MNIEPIHSSSKYIEQLTWLRGVAAFFVIVSHTIRASEIKYSAVDEPSRHFILSLFDLGAFGVILFFVLSGCTLYISNSDRIGPGNIRHFYIKRFFRIWPAFTVSLFICICFNYVLTNLYDGPIGPWIEHYFLRPYTTHDIFTYLTLTSNVFGHGGRFNAVYWSLPVEFQYYIIFPFIVASCKYAGIIGPLILGILLYWLPETGLFSAFDNVIFFMFAFTFCGGVLVGYIYKRTSFSINSVLGSILLITLALFASAIKNSYISLPDIPIISIKWNWYGVIAIVAVYITSVTKINLNVRVASFLKHYGTISYSLYLYHCLFVAIAILFILRFEIYGGGAKYFITFFFTLFATYLASTVSYKYIEKPFINIGRKIRKK